MVSTATHVCQEKLREEARGARHTGERPPAPDHDDAIVSSALLAGALRRLTTRQRVVIVWRYLFDFNVAQTAAALGLTDSNVRDAAITALGGSASCWGTNGARSYEGMGAAAADRISDGATGR